MDKITKEVYDALIEVDIRIVHVKSRSRTYLVPLTIRGKKATKHLLFTDSVPKYGHGAPFSYRRNAHFFRHEHKDVIFTEEWL